MHIILLILCFFRAKSPRQDLILTGTESTSLSNELLQAMQSFVTQQQQQQQPIWNTLSLQMQQNRQMTESLMNLPQLLIQNQKPAASATLSRPAQEQCQGLESADNSAHGRIDHDPVQDEIDPDFENVSEDDVQNQGAAANHVESEDFETFSLYDEMSKPLTLVEKIEKLYERLPTLTRPLPPSAQAASSVRDIPEIRGRIRSLPVPPLILDSFQRFRDSYRRQEGTVMIVDDHSGLPIGMAQEGDYSNRRKALILPTTKSDLQFQVHDTRYPLFSKLDIDYTKLFKAGSAETFQISRKQLNNLQMAASFTLDACCHLDALLLAIRKCLEHGLDKLDSYEYEGEEDYNQITADFTEGLEYLESAGFAEEFIIKKNVWAFSSVAAFMRENMLASTSQLDPELANTLKHLPFNAGKLYNK